MSTVICSLKNEECPEGCRHSKPHLPIHDVINFDDSGREIFGTCTTLYPEGFYPGSRCQWRGYTVEKTFCK